MLEATYLNSLTVQHVLRILTCTLWCTAWVSFGIMWCFCMCTNYLLKIYFFRHPSVVRKYQLCIYNNIPASTFLNKSCSASLVHDTKQTNYLLTQIVRRWSHSCYHQYVICIYTTTLIYFFTTEHKYVYTHTIVSKHVSATTCLELLTARF